MNIKLLPVVPVVVVVEKVVIGGAVVVVAVVDVRGSRESVEIGKF